MRATRVIGSALLAFFVAMLAFKFAEADDGTVLVPVVAESYTVPVIMGDSVVTLTVAVKGSNIISATSIFTDVRVGDITKIQPSIESAPVISSTLYGVKDFPDFPKGTKGEIDVVSVGPYEFRNGNTTVGVILRNNTDEMIYETRIEAEAYDDEGNFLGLGDNVFVLFPRAVQPGQITAGYLYFDGMEVREEDTLEIRPSYSPDTDSYREYGLAIEKFGRSSRTPDSIVGIVSNPNDIAVTTFRINLLCFESDTGKTSTDSGEAAVGVLEPGESTPFQIVSDCESYIINASGYPD